MVDFVLAGINVKSIPLDVDMAHFNIQVKPGVEGLKKPDWHLDPCPFVLVILMSDKPPLASGKNYEATCPKMFFEIFRWWYKNS